MKDDVEVFLRLCKHYTDQSSEMDREESLTIEHIRKIHTSSLYIPTRLAALTCWLFLSRIFVRSTFCLFTRVAE